MRSAMQCVPWPSHQPPRAHSQPHARTRSRARQVIREAAKLLSSSAALLGAPLAQHLQTTVLPGLGFPPDRVPAFLAHVGQVDSRTLAQTLLVRVGSRRARVASDQGRALITVACQNFAKSAKAGR